MAKKKKASAQLALSARDIDLLLKNDKDPEFDALKTELGLPLEQISLVMAYEQRDRVIARKVFQAIKDCGYEITKLEKGRGTARALIIRTHLFENKGGKVTFIFLPSREASLGYKGPSIFVERNVPPELFTGARRSVDTIMEVCALALAQQSEIHYNYC